MKIKTYLAALLLIFAFVVSAAEDPLVLRTPDGKQVRLADYAGDGRWLLVMIWGTDCSICFKEMPKISDFHTRHAHQDAHVLGVALDGFEHKQRVRDFAAREALSFPNLIAEMPGFGLRYELEVGERLLGTPTYLLFNPAGELVANNPGPVRASAVEAFMTKP